MLFNIVFNYYYFIKKTERSKYLGNSKWTKQPHADHVNAASNIRSSPNPRISLIPPFYFTLSRMPIKREIISNHDHVMNRRHVPDENATQFLEPLPSPIPVAIEDIPSADQTVNSAMDILPSDRKISPKFEHLKSNLQNLENMLLH